MLSQTVVSGYADSLGTVQVRLPLRYPLGDAAARPHEQFELRLAHTGRIVLLVAVEGTFIDAVACVVLHDRSTIRLTPLLGQPNRLGLKFQLVEVLLPHRALPRCVAVRLGDGPYMVVEAIDENYLFVSVKVGVDDFICLLALAFSLGRFEHWGSILVPYSFELRLAPFSMHLVSPCDLVVLLEDGALLHFRRAAPLANYEVHNFSEPTSILPFNFGWPRRAAEPLGGVAPAAVVDAVALSPSTFAAFLVNKTVRVWDLSTHRLALAVIDVRRSKTGPSLRLITSGAARHLEVVRHESQHVLVCHHLEDGGVRVSAWPCVDGVPQREVVLTPQPPAGSSAWLVQDFGARMDAGHLHLSILWKTNTASVYSRQTFDMASAQPLGPAWWSLQPWERSVLRTFLPYFDASYYSDKIFNSGYYNENVVKTSLAIFRNHIGFKDLDLSLANLSLRQAILETIGHDEALAKQNWYKLDLLCEEYKKLGDECLALWSESQWVDSVVLNANSVAVVRPAHRFECANPLVGPILAELAVILSTKTYIKVYRQVVEHPELDAAAVEQLFELLCRKISAEDRSRLVDEFVAVPNVLDELHRILDADDSEDDTAVAGSCGSLTKLTLLLSFKEIKSCHESTLLGLVVLLAIMEVNEQTLALINEIAGRLATYKLLNTVLDTSYTVNVAGSISGKVERNQLSNLENLLFWNAVVAHNPRLNCQISRGDINAAFDLVYSLLCHNYDLFISNVILDLISHDEGDLIKEIFIDRLNLQGTMGRLLIGLVHLISNDSVEFYRAFDSAPLDLKDYAVRSELTTIAQHLQANVHLRQFFDTILQIGPDEDVAIERATFYHALSHLATSQSKPMHSRFISPVTSTFLTSTDTSAWAERHGSLLSASSTDTASFKRSALKFEVRAVEALEAARSGRAAAKLATYHLDLFELALALNDYPSIHRALAYLDAHAGGDIDMRAIFTRLINHLITTRSILFVFTSPSPLFSKNYNLVDSILLDMANNELALAHLLKYYEYLYSWRLFGGWGAQLQFSSKAMGDKRGAVEALYIFITRFRHEQQSLNADGQSFEVDKDIKQYRLKVLELYMIILNVLKSFDNAEDRWIIKSADAEDALAVSTLEELNREYAIWLQKLQNEMSEWT